MNNILEEREYEVKPFDLDLWEMYKTFRIRKRLKKCTDFKVPTKWSFKISYYRYKGNDYPFWDQSKIDIYNDKKLYMTFYRNYGKEPSMGYAVQNGKEYLITSEDYMCITIINLTDKKINSYKIGNELCPLEFSVTHTLDNKIDVRVFGCVFAGPYIYFDLNNIDLSNFSISNDLQLHYDDRIDY